MLNISLHRKRLIASRLVFWWLIRCRFCVNVYVDRGRFVISAQHGASSARQRECSERAGDAARLVETRWTWFRRLSDQRQSSRHGNTLTCLTLPLSSWPHCTWFITVLHNTCSCIQLPVYSSRNTNTYNLITWYLEWQRFHQDINRN